MSERNVRQQVLELASQAVLQDRAAAYGTVENNFKNIATLWGTWLDIQPVDREEGIGPVDVAAMMILLKLARLANNKTHLDSWVDIAGYAACGAEVAESDDAGA